MKIVFTIFLFFIYCAGSPSAFAIAKDDSIEINLVDRQVKLVNLKFGDSTIKGDFSFNFLREDRSLIFNLSASNIAFGDMSIPWAKAEFSREGDIIFLRKLLLPNFMSKGNIDLEQNKLTLDIQGLWQEDSEFLKGLIKLKARVWGNFSNFITSGYFMVEDGEYQGEKFSSLRIDFLGKPPVLNVTDSELILTDGTVVRVEGVLDLRDFSNLIPNPEYIPQKIMIDQWQLTSGQGKELGFKKSLDGNIDVFLGADQSHEEATRAQTEVRYNLKDDKYLRLKMEKEGTSFRIENRTDF